MPGRKLADRHLRKTGTIQYLRQPLISFTGVPKGFSRVSTRNKRCFVPPQATSGSIMSKRQIKGVEKNQGKSIFNSSLHGVLYRAEETMSTRHISSPDLFWHWTGYLFGDFSRLCLSMVDSALEHFFVYIRDTSVQSSHSSRLCSSNELCFH